VGRLSRTHLKFRLDRDTYDILRQPSTTLSLLIVVVMHRDHRVWAVMARDQLVLRRCAYWFNLENLPPISTDSVTLSIPREQRFTVQFLRESMLALDEGGRASL